MNDRLEQLPVSRRWRGQAQPVPAVAAIIRRDIGGEAFYLLIRRLQPPYAGKWALVGGRWDFGETLSEAITREVWEETGLAPDFVGWRAFVDERIFPEATDDLGAHFLLFVCEVHASQGEAQEQAEGQVAWFNHRQLDDLHGRQDMAPTDYLILNHCLTSPPDLPCIEAEVVAQNAGSSTSRVRRFEITG